MSKSDPDDDDDAFSMFQEPKGFYQPEKQPTVVSYETITGHELYLRLVGHSPLWVGITPILISFLSTSRHPLP